MITATRSVAVVATSLPNTDRRALSQAWFSALHFAQPASVGASARPAQLTLPVASRGRITPATGASIVAGYRARQPAPLQRAAPAATPVPDRRSPAGELARRIERAIVRHQAVRTHHALAITINAGAGRVQLLVRTDGVTTRIVALCAPELRERVDRALAHARFALAASGTRLEFAQ